MGLVANSELLGKRVIWPDGTVEHAVIDKDGFICIDNVKSRKVGFCEMLNGFSPANFWDPAPMAALDTEFAYMQSVEIRTISILTYWAGIGMETHFQDVLQLAYNHKLYVLVTHSYWCGYEVPLGSFIDGYADFPLGAEHFSDHYPRLINAITTYPNVLVISLENEFESLQGFGYKFYAAQLIPYIATCKAIINKRLPVICKLSGYLGLPDYLTNTQKIELNNTIIHCVDLYANSPANFITILDYFRGLAAVYHLPSQSWVTEMGAPDSATYAASSMTPGIVNAVLADNVSLIHFFSTRNNDGSTNFFLPNGNPSASTISLMTNLPTWQAAIP